MGAKARGAKARSVIVIAGLLALAASVAHAGEDDLEGLDDIPPPSVTSPALPPPAGGGSAESDTPAAVVDEARKAQPFAELPGYWSGDGRLSFKDGKTEQVRCRATYFVENGGADLKQTIRCASGGGKVEVVSMLRNSGGKLSGTWTETNYSLQGDITGDVTPVGFRISAKGQDLPLSCNMDIIVRDKRQIVELQFFSETLLGLNLVLKKGEAK